MRKKPFLWFVLNIALLIMAPASTTYAREEKTEEEIKAKFIANYIPYIKWPRNIHAAGSSVNVCVMDGDLTAAYLRTLNDNPDKKFTIKVKEKDKKGDFSGCNILYINKTYTSDKDYLIKVTSGKPIFTVSDIDGFSEGGGMAGFRLVPGRDVTLEINMRSVTESKLEVDPDLLAIMKIIK